MPGIETECQTERSKAIARWFMLAALAPLLLRLTDHRTAWVVVGIAAAVCLAHTVYLFRIRECHPGYKYLTVGLDLALLTVGIYLTGGSQSPFFFVYFLVLVSNCIRYGLLMSLYIAALVNVLYVGALLALPPMLPSVVGGEGLKILAFWAVALYGGAVSARIRRQAYEVASYEETIGELRARVAELEAGSGHGQA